MKRFAARTVVATVAVAIASSVGIQRADAVPTANTIEFSYSISQFLSIKAQAPAPYNWSDDGCSASIFASIVNHYFLNQCKRHDFGYRNWRSITGYSSTSALRLAIDDRFHSDMNTRCSQYSVFNPERYTCYATDDSAYLAVRALGSLN